METISADFQFDAEVWTANLPGWNHQMPFHIEVTDHSLVPGQPHRLRLT
ncbi:MAG: hypothetical protein OCD02_23320 [Spirochaetaceae bacterium]